MHKFGQSRTSEESDGSTQQGKEYNKDGEQHLLWREFDGHEFYNTKHAHFTLFTDGGIWTEQDGGNDEFYYQHVTENMNKGNDAVGQNTILLDNQSTCNVFYAGHLLRNIRRAKHSLTIISNTWSTKTACMWDIPGFVPVWFHKNGISNIIEAD